jgi:hypothetical protein
MYISLDSGAWLQHFAMTTLSSLFIQVTK